MPGTDVSTLSPVSGAKQPRWLWSVIGMLCGNSFQHFMEAQLQSGSLSTELYLLPGSWAWGCQRPWKKNHEPTLPTGCLCRTPGWNCFTRLIFPGFPGWMWCPCWCSSSSASLSAPTGLICRLQPVSADPTDSVSSGTELPPALGLILAQSEWICWMNEFG